MTKRRYMLTDLGIFALLFCLLEAASAYALKIFAGEVYTVSLVLFISLLMMMRWGIYGLFHAFLGGIVYSLLQSGTMMNTAVFAIGGLAVGANLILLKTLGGQRIRDSVPLTVLYCAAGYAELCLGRAAAAAITAGAGFIPILIRFLTTDMLSAVLTLVFILIARKQNGLFEPQELYLKRLQKEDKKRGY